MDRPAHLVVGLLKKPHGIKGEAILYPATDEPDAVFRAGRVLAVLDPEGAPTGREVVIERARAYHRAWLLLFRGFEKREQVDELREHHLALRPEDVRDLEPGEYYLHELVGLAVETVEGAAVGTVAEVIEAPQGPLLAVQDGGKQHLVPFIARVVVRVDREARRIVIAPPAGLLEV